MSNSLVLLLLVLNLSGDVNAYDCKAKNRLLHYYKIKSCHKSTQSIVFWKSVAELSECITIAREKNGLGFNFIPPEGKNYINLLTPNCQILGCPEIGNATKLVIDLAYDYYSAYGNLNVSENYTCIKSLGLFGLTNKYQTYGQSILTCQSMGGDLADISTEGRTMLLSELINASFSEWYKAAYVGLDDIENEGVFRTTSGILLSCSKAWAPGHPRSKYKSEDCVILDSERLWRVVNCNKIKLRGLCELYPQPPKRDVNTLTNITCRHLSNKHKDQRKCINLKEMSHIYQHSSRADRCALLNFK